MAGVAKRFSSMYMTNTFETGIYGSWFSKPFGSFYLFYDFLIIFNVLMLTFGFFRKSMTEYDPRLVTPTCLYLASKAEESTVQARLLVFYIKKMCKCKTLSKFSYSESCICFSFLISYFVLCDRAWWKVSFWNQGHSWNGNETLRSPWLLFGCLSSLSSSTSVSFHILYYFLYIPSWWWK